MRQKRNKVIKNILFVSVVGLLLLIYQLNFKIILIDGPSMAPTYQDHQPLFLQKTTSDIKLNDVIVFQYEETLCVKRVLASEGDIISLRDNHVFVNGVMFLQSSYEGENKEYVLSEGEYFVMGDNYLNSLDSRNFGAISSNQILGVVL